MKIRFHRGTLQESLATAAEVENTLGAIVAYLSAEGLIGGHVAAEYYGRDDRAWGETWVVSIDGKACAFTDQEPCWT